MLTGGEGEVVKEESKEQPDKEIQKDVEKESPASGEEKGKLPEKEVSASEKQKIEKALKTFESINTRYINDPNFRKGFDNLWQGMKDAESKDNDADNDDRDMSPIEQMRKEMESLRKDLGIVREVVGYDKITQAREKINDRYENDFRKMAEKVGYDVGSPAYESLYSDTIRECKKRAAAFGLRDKDGNIDTLKEYNKEFMKESFDAAFDKHKQAGFDEAWKRRQEALASEKSQKKMKDENPYKEILKPENLKTFSGRAEALRKMFKVRFKDEDLSHLTKRINP